MGEGRREGLSAFSNMIDLLVCVQSVGAVPVCTLVTLEYSIVALLYTLLLPGSLSPSLWLAAPRWSYCESRRRALWRSRGTLPATLDQR